jgi:hypothetical protein
MHEISTKFPSRMVTATALFILGSLASSARLLVDRPSPRRRETDLVTQRSDLRFAALRPVLPKRGVVGYVGESDDSTADYYLAQYALAPLVVDRSANHPLVIGNFPSSPLPLQTKGLRLVRDFGSGVLLFAHEEQE